MAGTYDTVDQYLNTRPAISANYAKLNGILSYELAEASDSVHIKNVLLNSVVVALSKTDTYQASLAGLTSCKPRVAGDVMIVPAGVSLQTEWQVKDYLMRSYALEFTDDLFRNYLPEVCTSRFTEGHLLPGTPVQRPELLSISLLIKRELVGSLGRGKLFLDSAMRLFAIEIASAWWSAPSVMPCHGSHADKRIARAIEYIEGNFCSDISLLDIAHAAGCSLSLLTSKFEGQTGKTPYSYVIDRRIRYAEEMLMADSMSIAQVALEAGFGDQQHLTRVMRARRGQTPRMVRLGLAS